MRKSGGIIALIGSIFGVLAALVALAIARDVGWVSTSNTVVRVSFPADGGYSEYFFEGPALTTFMAWSTVISCIAVFMLAVICLNVDKRLPAILLIVCAAVAAILGGAHVALFMGMALVGGILALFPKPKQAQYA